MKNHVIVTLLLSLSLLFSCGRDAEVTKTSQPSPAVTPPPAPEPVEVPFEERLAALELHAEKCAAPQAAALTKIDTELRELYLKELEGTKTLPEARNVDASLTPYFSRVRALAQGCQNEKLFPSPQDAVAARFVKEAAEASCESFFAEGAINAYRIFSGKVRNETKQALAKLLATCGHTDSAANEASFRASKLGSLELKRQAAARSACSVDSLYFAEESSAQLEVDYQAVAKPQPASRLLALQLHLDLDIGFRQLRAGCDETRQAEPALALQGLEAELAALETRPDRCSAGDTLASLKARAAEAEAADLAKLLSSRFRQTVKDRYQGFLTRAQLLEAGCEAQKESNLRDAKVQGLKARWSAFTAAESYTEARLAEATAFQAEIAPAKAADARLTLTPAGRAEVARAYKEIEASVSQWLTACRAAISAEKERKRLEEEKRKEEERKRIEEEKRKKAEEEKKRLEEEQRKKAEEEKKRLEEEKRKKAEEAERKRLEEEKRKEEERKRLEEEKRKKTEEEKKRLEEEKRKKEEAERKRLEEEKRKKEEAERKRIEEQKRVEEERKRIEEEKRKQEGERRRQEEERKRAEQEKFKSVEEKRQKLTPPKWEQLKNPAHKVWTNTVLSVVRKRMADFDQARDAGVFCPGYHQAALHERENCWVLLVSYIAFKESHYKLQSSFVEGNGVASVGFLALSAGECPNAPTARDLNDPVKNLACGTNKMASLIAKDKMISDTDIGPDLIQRRNGRGAAAYWSTLKPKHKVYHKINKRWYTVGFKPLFQEWLKDYKSLRR